MDFGLSIPANESGIDLSFLDLLLTSDSRSAAELVGFPPEKIDGREGLFADGLFDQRLDERDDTESPAGGLVGSCLGVDSGEGADVVGGGRIACFLELDVKVRREDVFEGLVEFN